MKKIIFYFLAFLALTTGGCTKKITCDSKGENEHIYCYRPVYKYINGNAIKKWELCVPSTLCEANEINSECYIRPYNEMGPHPEISLNDISNGSVQLVKKNDPNTLIDAYTALDNDPYRNQLIYSHYYNGTISTINEDSELSSPCSFTTKSAPTLTIDESYTINSDVSCKPSSFKTASTNVLFAENCSYYTDTKTGLEKSKVIMAYVDFIFNKDKNYGLYIYDNADPTKIKSFCPIDWVDKKIRKINPVNKPNDPAHPETRVTATIKSKVDFPIGGLERTVTMYLRSYGTDYNVFDPQDIVPPFEFKLRDKQKGEDGFLYAERLMNLRLYGGTGAFRNNIKDYYASTQFGSKSFSECFTEVFTNSEIHLFPNYLPAVIPYSPTRNPDPGNTPLPEFLVDKDGDAVLLLDDMNKLSEMSPAPSDEELFTMSWSLWFRRISSFSALIRSGKSASAITLQQVKDNISDHPYSNTIDLFVIKGFKIYKTDYPNVSLSPYDYSFRYNGKTAQLPQYIIDHSYPKIIGDHPYGIPNGIANSTTKLGCYNPVAVVIKNSLDLHLNEGVNSINSFCVAVAMHELGHAWYGSGTNDNNKPTYNEKHIAYVTGKGSRYCLMRTTPMTNYNGPLDSSIELINGSYYQMQFSEGLQQQIGNVLCVTR